MKHHCHANPLDYAVDYLKKKFDKGYREMSKTPDSAMASLIKLHTGIDIVDVNEVDGTCKIKLTGEKAEKLVERAKRDPVAFQVVTELAAELLRENDLLPDSLKEFASNVLENRTKRPTRKGRSPYEAWFRNRYFAILAFHLREKYGVQLYRNDASAHRQSCFDIIAKAVEICAKDTGDRELFPSITYDVVRRAWEALK